jgi:S-adenosylmethionine hydrolase
LAAGATLAELGTPIDASSLTRLPDPTCRSREHEGHSLVEAEVTWVDRFGNVQLAAKPELLPAQGAVEVSLGQARWRAKVVTAFADLASGELGILTDSYGYLALVFNGGNAASRLGVKEQDIFVLEAPSAAVARPAQRGKAAEPVSEPG